jgi:DNA invertase Pin-like site-specific DNA recombinase
VDTACRPLAVGEPHLHPSLAKADGRRLPIARIASERLLYNERVGTGEKVVGYARVSTEEQGVNGAGLDAQRAAIEAECARRGWVLLRIEEDVLSGKTIKRPGLQAALDACRGGEATGIVVAKLDRLSRSILDFASVLEEARRRGFNVVTLDLGLDLSTPQAELVANVIASVAQWERRIVGERTREALAVKKAQGVRIGRPPTLPPAIARRILRARASGLSLAAIADRLNAERVPTAQGGRRWYPATVRYTLRRLDPETRG